MSAAWPMIILLSLTITSNVWAQPKSIESLQRFWEENALLCEGVGFAPFPTKRRDAQKGCEDGDMTLFNGLLCASGDARGCSAVRASLDEATGLWHRSPRIKQLGYNDRGNADSSPDMALGVQLYLTVSKDVAAARKWFDFLNQTYLCLPSPSDPCPSMLPKFCKHDDCVMRPQDLLMLKVTVDYLQQQVGFGALPAGPLQDALSQAKGSNAAMLELLARVQRPGFPPHLVAVGIWTMRLSGRTEPRLDTAAKVLAGRFPSNPFFLWMSGSKKDDVEASLMRQCPADLAQQIHPWDDWQWESYGARADGSLPSQHSSMWDCIFMANLVRNGVASKWNKKGTPQDQYYPPGVRSTGKGNSVRPVY